MGLLSKLLGHDSRPPLAPPTYSSAAVIARIEKEHGVDAATAHGWFGEMLIFLDLCARSDDMLSPPPDVDKAWHAFLLHSRDYEAYCKERFGRVIHHQPTGEPDPDAYRRAYDRRREYANTSTADPGLWAVPMAAAGSDSPPSAEPAPSDPDGFGCDASGDSIGSTDSGGGSSCGSSCGGGGS
jgi:hypothetical protein